MFITIRVNRLDCHGFDFALWKGYGLDREPIMICILHSFGKKVNMIMGWLDVMIYSMINGTGSFD